MKLPILHILALDTLEFNSTSLNCIHLSHCLLYSVTTATMHQATYQSSAVSARARTFACALKWQTNSSHKYIVYVILCNLEKTSLRKIAENFCISREA